MIIGAIVTVVIILLLAAGIWMHWLVLRRITCHSDVDIKELFFYHVSAYYSGDGNCSDCGG